MPVDPAVESAVRERPDLVADTRRRRPKAWGQLAGLGVLAFRRIAGRAPTDAERRAIWAGLWRVVETEDPRTRSDRCGSCAAPLDPALHAACSVCDGLRLCLACARGHLCTSECRARGCLPGLCVKVVRDGLVADAFGVD